MRRRQLLKGMMALPVIGTGLLMRSPLRLSEAQAAVAGRKTLVVIFQRGANDGLNTVVPFGEDAYYRLRPTLAVPRPGRGSGSALNLDGFFGLHPTLAPLHALFQQGRLAVMPSVHYPNATRSHFAGQHLIESGTTSASRADGWLNRYLKTRSRSLLSGAAFGSSQPFALRGPVSAPTVRELGDGLGGPPEYQATLTRDLKTALNQRPGGENARLLHSAGLSGLNQISALRGLRSNGYRPSNGAKYPQSDFGKALANIAQLIKARQGLEVATVDIGGWDTHSDQGARQPQRLAELASGMSALYKDLTAHRNELVILTMTEFGRTAKENASRGTDHGNASAWLALGGGVNGGIYGEWPGLSTGQLYQGRYLAQSIDFRDVMGEVLRRHLQATSLSAILPNHNPRAVGFL